MITYRDISRIKRQIKYKRIALCSLVLQLNKRVFFFCQYRIVYLLLKNSVISSMFSVQKLSSFILLSKSCFIYCIIYLCISFDLNRYRHRYCRFRSHSVNKPLGFEKLGSCIPETCRERYLN